MCTGTGHTTCNKVADWIASLTGAVNGLLADPTATIPQATRASLGEILNSDPGTSNP
jgi:hypothetical protein